MDSDLKPADLNLPSFKKNLGLAWQRLQDKLLGILELLLYVLQL